MSLFHTDSDTLYNIKLHTSNFFNVADVAFFNVTVLLTHLMKVYFKEAFVLIYQTICF